MQRTPPIDDAGHSLGTYSGTRSALQGLMQPPFVDSDSRLPQGYDGESPAHPKWWRRWGLLRTLVVTIVLAVAGSSAALLVTVKGP
jgi:hypothetical protein